MRDLPTHVDIHEEGPREGFQIEPGPISTADKIKLIEALALSAMYMEGIVSKNVEAPYRSGRNESWFKIKWLQGQVSDRRLCEGPCRRRGAASRQARGEGLRLCQVGTGFNRKSSMEIRKKSDAFVSSKSRL